MTRLARFAALVALSVAALPAAAQTFRALNWLEVNPVSAEVFEVVGQPGSGPQQYWCAAGDYARRVLGAAPTQPVYLVRGRGPSVTTRRRSAVQFSLVEPPVDYRPGYSLSVTDVGERLNAASARFYCESLFPRGFW